MQLVVIPLVVFAVVLGAGVLGATLRSRLPDHHVSSQTWPVVAISIGFISTMNAIVLGLLVASAKGSYDATAQGLQEAAANVILLDRTLREYGPQTQPIRTVLHNLVKANASSMTLGDKPPTSTVATRHGASTEYGYEEIQESLRVLSPTNEAQHALQIRAVQIIDAIAQTHWLLVAQKPTAGISMPLLVTLVAWLAVIAGCTGLFAPRHGTMFVIALLCVCTISGTIFLVISMYNPFNGPLKLSAAPLLQALRFLEQP